MTKEERRVADYPNVKVLLLPAYGLCAILNQRAEQKERIAQLEKDKVELVDVLEDTRRLGLDNMTDIIDSTIAKHEVSNGQ